jgi:hypothetical protein
MIRPATATTGSSHIARLRQSAVPDAGAAAVDRFLCLRLFAMGCLR